MRLLIMSVAVAALTASAPMATADQSILDKSYEGSGEWFMEGAVTGTWTSKISLSQSDRGLVVLDEMKINTDQGVMEESTEWLADSTSSGFFNVMKIDRDQSQQQQQPQQQLQQQQSLLGVQLTTIGSGYCIEKICHIETMHDGIAFEETYIFKNDKLKRIGSMGLSGAADKKTSWKALLGAPGSAQ